ncbi:hypothetical protein H2509_14325 [Stappia sp. F7233]|uniref:histidine kinase n=1 Tax=Stappia albiluteola TaxID=2758565 RepID=A0A839AHB6_9HYPH|nr:ATP-binding protein [Stappia albiluteola]MBA5778302.1 hypothetical protein [Stappia albiluteola]
MAATSGRIVSIHGQHFPPLIRHSDFRQSDARPAGHAAPRASAAIVAPPREEADILAQLLCRLTQEEGPQGFAEAVARDIAAAFPPATCFLVLKRVSGYLVEAISRQDAVVFEADLSGLLSSLSNEPLEVIEDLSLLSFWNEREGGISRIGRTAFASSHLVDGETSIVLCLWPEGCRPSERDARLFRVMAQAGHEATLRLKSERERNFQMAKFRQGQKLEALGQLASSIAHEINTPVQFVTDNLTFLRDILPDLMARASGGGVSGDERVEALLKEAPDAIQDAIAGMEQIARIVRTMRGVSHPGMREVISCDVNAALENAATLCRGDLKQVADVYLDLDRSLPSIEALAGELDQVWLNLIVNALHALRKSEAVALGGRGFLTLRTRHEYRDTIIVEVEDSGCGIESAIVDRIFDPFFTTKDVGEGTGQGLAIVRDIIVNRHGGRIDVISTPGEGSCFTIVLPVKKGLDPASDILGRRPAA